MLLINTSANAITITTGVICAMYYNTIHYRPYLLVIRVVNDTVLSPYIKINTSLKYIAWQKNLLSLGCFHFVTICNTVVWYCHRLMLFVWSINIKCNNMMAVLGMFIVIGITIVIRWSKGRCTNVTRAWWRNNIIKSNAWSKYVLNSWTCC